jgi:hypothetical protein
MSEAPGIVLVRIDGEIFTEYHYQDADRPYFYPLIAPTGDNITRHFPMKKINSDEQSDHPHHRSLWYTHGAVNGHDFWHRGKVVQTKLEVISEKDRGILICENEWRAGDGKVVCSDRRKHTIMTREENRIVDFEITLRASHGKIVLGDTKEGSMAFRVAPTLRLKGKVARGSIVNSEGDEGRSAWGKRARWCDYYGPLNGKTVGIALMDHPDNPRHPTWWHARDYGLCTANPFGISYFERKPRGTGNMEIEDGKSVTFKYRVLIHKGSTGEAGLDRLYREYAGAAAPGPASALPK